MTQNADARSPIDSSAVGSDAVAAEFVRGGSSTDLPIVCISSVPWSFLRQRPQQLTELYSRRAPVLYVEPPRRPGRRILVGYLRPTLRHEAEHLWSLTVQKAFPFDRAMPALRRFNEMMTRRIVRSTFERLEFGDSILWFYYLNSFKPVRLRNTKMVVYDCVDDLSGFWQPYPDATLRENRLVSLSDVVFTSSSRLYDLKSRLNPNTFLVPNGVDFNHFSADSGRRATPPSMETMRRPIIGFSGAFYGRIDLDLLETVARRRRDWSFVFVGPVNSGIQVPRAENMHFLGEVPYAVLPWYVAAFDVCLLPFKRYSLTESANPIKMYEYLAAGKHVASTGIPEARQFAELIEIADGADGFEKAISRALEMDSLDRQKARRQVAKQNSWDRRVETIGGILERRREILGV